MEAPADIHAAARPASPPRNPPPLRRVLVVALVVPVATVSLLLALISILTSRAIARHLGDEVLSSVSSRVAADVRAYLSSAVRTSDRYARMVRRGELPATDLDRWRRTLYNDLQTTPDVASICLGAPNGFTVYMLRSPRGIEFGIADAGTENVYLIDSDGNKPDKPFITRNYDPRVRPWYKQALASAEPSWTPVYFWFPTATGDAETGTGYTRAITDASGELAGVLVVDVTLSQLNGFLGRMLPEEGSAIIVTDQGGQLVAASDGRVTAEREQSRLTPGQSNSPKIAQLGAALPSIDTSAGKADAGAGRDVALAGVPSRLRMTSLGPYPGIAWAITTALPERAFMADAESLQTRAIVLSVGAVLLAGGLAFWLSRTLSRPLLRLSEHVAKVGGGDFDARLHLDDAAELRTVSDAINRMAGGLRQRLELEQSLQVAMHVQQSLLPNEPPHIRGLDIAGQSKYCDATGGDYFDFLQVSPLDDGVAMIAIGDVMGHGVGAALLMATARAAVHASVVGGRPLAEIMGDVNRVLSRDARHGLFMTMLLALVDTRTRCVRWCSAGHDPIICYDPSADSFFELEGGDIPLGIIEDQPYTMHAKTMLHAGTVLLAGTDGVWEARNEAGELYGKDRLKQLIRTHARSPSMAIASELELDLRRYVGPRPMHDDVTFIVVRVTG